jgi:hypothetical protein
MKQHSQRHFRSLSCAAVQWVRTYWSWRGTAVECMPRPIMPCILTGFPLSSQFGYSLPRVASASSSPRLDFFYCALYQNPRPILSLLSSVVSLHFPHSPVSLTCHVCWL